MIKRFLSLIFILLLSAVAVKPAYANVVGGGFSDTESSIGNSFSASSLFFSVTDTGDKPLDQPYFNIENMNPGDSQSKTIRIKKEGIENFKYNITFHQTGGDDGLCNALQVETKLEGTSLYSGNLSALTIDPRPTISSSGTDQWEIIISLPSDSSSDLKNNSCSFDLVFKGWQTNSDGSWGFTDQHTVGNNATTGTWEDGLTSDTSQNDQSGTVSLQATTDTNTDQNQDDLSLTPTPTPSDTPTPTPTPDESLTPDNSTVTQTDGGGTN